MGRFELGVGDRVRLLRSARNDSHFIPDFIATVSKK